MLTAFELDEGRRGERAYARYLETRALDRDAVLSDDALREPRRGWYIGDESNVTVALRRVRESRGLTKRLRVLEDETSLNL